MNSKEKEYFKKLAEERTNDAKVLQKPDYRGIWASIIDKYPDSAHFIYELLQNADDAKATKVMLKLTKNGFTFKHNGKVRFTISDPSKDAETERLNGRLGHVNSIASIGASTKSSTDGENKIGKFGVGFKSVFQYTSTPHIYDEKIRFKLIDYIIPQYLEKEHEWRNVEETLFYLPFDRVEMNAERSYFEIKSRLENLDNPILFLNNLQEIIWEKSPTTVIYRKEILNEKLNINGIIYRHLRVLNKDESNPVEMLMFSRMVRLNEGDFPISIGYFVNNKGKVITTFRPKIFCFFPTSESLDLCFVMHAPFALVDNRQQIKQSEPINILLIKELAKLSADALPIIRDIGVENKKFALDDNLLKIIPIDYKNKNPFLKEFYYKIREKISNESLFLTQSKKYVSCKQAIWAEKEIKNLLSIKQINSLIAYKQYNDSNIDKNELENRLKSDIFQYVLNSFTLNDSNNELTKDFIKELNIKIYKKSDFENDFSIQFITNQNEEWLDVFYRFICDNRNLREIYKIGFLTKSSGKFRYLPIIRLKTGKFVVPFIETDDEDKVNVYLPSTFVSNKLNIVDKKLLAQSQNFKKLVEVHFGIKAPDKKAHVYNVILTKYDDEKPKVSDFELISDFDMIFSYYLECPQNEIEDYLNKITNTLFVKATNLLGVKDCKNINLLYASYENMTPETQDYFKGNNDAWFFDSEFYVSLFEKYEKFNELIDKLNFNTTPIIWTNEENDVNKSYLKKKDDISKIEGSIISWRLNQHGKYEQYHSLCVVKIKDYWIDGLEIFLSRSDYCLTHSQFLWAYLADKLKPEFLKAPCTYLPYNDGRRSYRVYNFKSIIKELLEQHKWLFTESNERRKPSQVFIEELTAYSNNKLLFEQLGIKSSPQSQDDAIINQQCSTRGKETFGIGKIATHYGLDSDEKLAKAAKLFKDEEARIEAENERIKKNQENKSKTSLLKTKQNHKTAEELFSSTPNESKSEKLPNGIPADNIKQIEQQQKHLIEEQNRLAELKLIADDLSIKYTTKWFNALLELEIIKSGEEKYEKKGMSIIFYKIEQETNAERIIKLSNPSRYVPQVLEECSNISVTFHLYNQSTQILIFEVANVQEYSLRLKCKNEDTEMLNLLLKERGLITRAVLSTKTPVKIINELSNVYILIQKYTTF